MPAIDPARPTQSEHAALSAAAERTANKDQPDGYAGLDSNGNVLVNGLIARSDTAAALVLEQAEIGYETDTGRMVYGDGSVNKQFGATSPKHIEVVPVGTPAENAAALIAARDAAMADVLLQAKESVTYVNDASIASPTTETTFTINDASDIRAGDLLTWGTDGTGSGTFDDTTFSGEWMRVLQVMSGNTIQVIRAVESTTAAAIADTLNLYRIPRSNQYTLRAYAGEYDFTAESVAGLDLNTHYLSLIGPDGPELTRLYRTPGDASQVTVVSLSGQMKLKGVAVGFGGIFPGTPWGVGIQLNEHHGLIENVRLFTPTLTSNITNLSNEAFDGAVWRDLRGETDIRWNISCNDGTLTLEDCELETPTGYASTIATSSSSSTDVHVVIRRSRLNGGDNPPVIMGLAGDTFTASYSTFLTESGGSTASSVQVYNASVAFNALQCSFNSGVYDYGLGSQDTIANYNDLGNDAASGCIQNANIA